MKSFATENSLSRRNSSVALARARSVARGALVVHATERTALMSRALVHAVEPPCCDTKTLSRRRAQELCRDRGLKTSSSPF